MIFQEVISQSEGSVKTLRETLQAQNLAKAFNSQWEEIENNVDFLPIFNVANEILMRLPASDETERTLRELAETSIQILSNRAAIRHDLMGRIYHKLLADAKFFGAFYTKITAATILLKLTLNKFESSTEIDWIDPRSISQLRVGDLACGTGTLLKAALAAIEDRHIAACAIEGKLPESDELHKQLIEKGLWGFDVLASAIHLAAVAVAMHDPRVRVSTMHFYTVPLGGKSRKNMQLGSINFARSRALHAQMRLIGATIGASSPTSKENAAEALSLPILDICTMNPPFTRSVYGNLLFGSLEELERSQLRDYLKEVVRETHLNANITAGLGTVFFAIADKVTAKDGMLSFVLPKAVLNGSTWKPTRDLIRNYDLLYVITSHEPDNWNFSETTQLSEVLLIVKKTQKPSDQRTIFVNLWEQPKTTPEAITLVHTIEHGTPANLDEKVGTCELRTNGRKYGEMLATSLRNDLSWAIPAAFAQTDLCRAARYLARGEIFYPTLGIVGKMSLTKLGVLAELGPDGRDVKDAFDTTDSETSYKAFWGHKAKFMRTLKQNTNTHLSPLSRARPGRNLRDANLLWSRSGSLMLPKEMWLPTNRLAAVTLQARALSNVWWPTRWRKGNDTTQRTMERNLAMWFNSTLGLFSLVMQREETRGAWSKFPKTWYEELEVLDFEKFSTDQLQMLDALWTSVAEKEFAPLPQMKSDPVRKELDVNFAAILGIPPLDDFREAFAREPFFKGTAEPPENESDAEEEVE
jgi:hypothetical protein